MLPFAAQPRIHHPPSGDAGRPGRVAFAGSYYATKHATRREQMEALLDPAREHGLHIFDRHAGDDHRFAWPERFRRHVVASLTYPQTLEAYRRYQVFINVNTVTGSPSMCARRVFELAACGTPILSGPSRALAEMAPGEAIAIANDRADAEQHLADLLGDAHRRREMAEVARSWVLGGHTYSDRLAQVISSVRL